MMRPSVAAACSSACSWVIFCLWTRPASWPRVTSSAFLRPRSTNSCLMSLRITGMPADAITWAISPPIVPAPTTAALNTNTLWRLLVVGGAAAVAARGSRGAPRALSRAARGAAGRPPPPARPGADRARTTAARARRAVLREPVEASRAALGMLPLARDEALGLQRAQQRVHRVGVHADQPARQLADALHQLVAVRRTVAEQVQDEQPQQPGLAQPRDERIRRSRPTRRAGARPRAGGCADVANGRPSRRRPPRPRSRDGVAPSAQYGGLALTTVALGAWTAIRRLRSPAPRYGAAAASRERSRGAGSATCPRRAA